MIDTARGVGGIFLDVAMEAADAFGPLKAALGAISVIYAKYEVPLRPFTRKKLLTDPCIGNSRRHGKNSKAQLTHSAAGANIQSTFR